jgi:homoserine dehydrogenase
VPANWLLADVAGAKNAVYVQSYALGPSMYYGAGAGMLPTAMSVVSDCIDLGRNIFARAAGAKRPAAAVLAHKPMLPLAEVRSKYYLRFGVVDAPGVLGRLMTILGEMKVSIAQVVQDAGHASEGPVSVVVVTHEAREGDVRAALAAIDALPVVKEPARVIRIVG